jgi:hypothetical protein
LVFSGFLWIDRRPVPRPSQANGGRPMWLMSDTEVWPFALVIVLAVAATVLATP